MQRPVEIHVGQRSCIRLCMVSAVPFKNSCYIASQSSRIALRTFSMSIMNYSEAVDVLFRKGKTKMINFWSSVTTSG